MSPQPACPVSLHRQSLGAETRPTCVAPAAARASAVAFPCWILFTRATFVVVGFGTRHALASYLSMQVVPAMTESGGHFVSGPAGGPAAPAALASNTSTVTLILVVCIIAFQ